VDSENGSPASHAIYPQRFNRRHRRVGHVLQGRFKAIFGAGIFDLRLDSQPIRQLREGCADALWFKTWPLWARRSLPGRFPYAIYFVTGQEAIVVIAALHRHREPETRRARVSPAPRFRFRFSPYH